MDIYDYGHWEDKIFVLNEPLTHNMIDEDGVQAATIEKIDCRHTFNLNDGSEATLEDLEEMIEMFLDPETTSIPSGLEDTELN